MSLPTLTAREDVVDGCNEALESMADNTERFECSICYEQLPFPHAAEPRPCGHSAFCMRCIATWLREQPTSPTCRAAVQVSNSGHESYGDQESIGRTNHDDWPSRSATPFEEAVREAYDLMDALLQQRDEGRRLFEGDMEQPAMDDDENYDEQLAAQLERDVEELWYAEPGQWEYET